MKKNHENLETMFSLFAFASEGDPSRGSIDETADKHSLWGAFAGHVVSHLVVELVRPNHVATVPIHTAQLKRDKFGLLAR